MKNLSRRMKRLLAILLVETIVAVNVISGYASESDGVYTISEAEVEAELQESGNEPVVIQEEVSDDSQDFYEESSEEQELQQEDQNASEGEMASDENVASEEQPVAEEPSLPDEGNAEQTDGETGATEEAKEETADTCTCEKACSTSEYDAACPVCSTVADLEEGAKEAFLKESCLKYSGQKEEQETVEPEIVNKESNITIKGISIADGTSISGSSEFEIQVADEVTLSEQAPEITGYEFTGKAYVKTNDGDVEASEIKKETIETEKKEDGVVTQIIIETKWSFYDVNGETWTELTEDTTVAFEYKKLEEAVEEDEEAIVVNFYAVCVDEDGNVIDGFEKTELAVSDSLDLTKAPVTIDGYNYVEANIGDATVISLDQSKSTDADGKETTVYSYTTADGKVEVTEDVTVTLSYEMTEEEKTAIHFYAECIDEKGNAIADYEKKTLHFSGSMDLTAEPFAIEEYEYVEAAIDGTVVLSVDKATVEDKDGKETIAYSYTTADGSVEVSEDTTVTLTYKSVKKAAEVTLTWSYVDEEGLTIEGAEGEPKFDDTLVLDDTEKAPVVIEGYEYVEATIDGVVITAITKTVEDADAEAAAEETADAEPVYSYAYTTAAGESVAIEEDTEITLGYEETGIPVKVDATVVDEFGDEIDEKYTNMELPKFTDGELVLNDVENPPVAKVQIRKSLFKVIKYTYVQATIDNKIITGLKREATAATADLKEKEQEYIYSYTTDGENWTKLKEDTTVYFEYTDGRKTVFTYEDSKVLVTATLQHAGAIPDDAEFVVTEITSGQAYDAYIAALNNASDEDKEYSEQNTLLYDMAFVGINDETGNTIEIEPSEGSVKISIVFKQNQLAEELQAVGSEEVEIKHLPINDAIKESAGTTVNAVGITASDVSVENVGSPTVSIEGEVAEFVTSSFTVYSVSSNPSVSVKKVNLNVKDIINKKAGFDCGIIANTYEWAGDTETNMMVGSYYSTAADLGVSASYGNAGGDNYFGDVLVDLLRFHLAPANVYLGIDATQKYESGDFKFENITGTTIHKNYSIDVSSKIASIGSSVNDGISNNDASNLKDERTNLDLTKLEAGTYVVNYDGTGTLFADKLNININSDQNLIINCTSTELNINRFTINNNHPTTFIGSNVADSDVYTTSVIFNCPNATSVNLCEVPGIIIAPNATVNVYGTSAGILVANNVIGRGAEWHYHNHDLPAPGEAELELEIVKSYNKTLVANQFTFTLKDASGKVVGTASNDATGKVRFPKLTYAAEGTYTYTITENIPTDAITNADGTKTSGRINYENSIITAIVNVEKNTALNKFEAVSITYSKVDAKGNPITSNVNTIINEETDKGSLSVTKSVIGTTATEPFYFTVKDSSGNLVSRDGSTVFAINAGSTVTIGELPFGTYTIQETDASGDPVSYTPGTFPYRVSYSSENVEVSATADGSATITNTFVEETSVSVNKEWVDNENHDGLRPSEIQVQLKANNADVSTPVTLNEKNGWSYTWGNLEKNDAQGNAITYAVDEVSVPAGYSKSVSSDGTHYTITNTHENEKVKAKVIKVWNDNGNQDGKRQDIEVTLKKNDTEEIQTVTLTADNNWTAIVENLPKYEKGTEIKYSWSEETLPEGYSLSAREEKTVISGTITTLTNSYTPGKTSASVKKVWEDQKNQDGIRPESIAVKLVKTNNGIKTDVQEVTLNSENNWETTITNLPKYTGGKENVYSWEEVNLPTGYILTGNTTNGTVTTLTNKHTPTTINVTIQKVWEDQNNQDGKRPQTLIVELMNGNKTVATVYLSEGNNWTATVFDLDEYADGVKIDYTWAEKNLPEGYTLKTTSTKGGTAEQGVITTLTNVYTPEKVRVTVKKAWDDQNNQDGKRPTELKVDLMNGKTLVQTVTLNEGNGWKATVSDLDKYADGQPIEYTWVEKDLPEGYSLSKTPETSVGSVEEGIITTLTNTHTPGKTSASVKKVWDDAENRDGQRPESIEVKLMVTNNNEKTEVSNAGKIVLNEDNEWSAIVTELPEYTGGRKNVYSWEEVQIPEGYTLTGNSTEGTVTTLTNTHTPKLVNVAVKKEWKDQNDQDGKRPTDLTVELWKNNTTVIETVTLNSTNDWTATIQNLPEYENGSKITYSWVEKDLPEGYSLSEPVVTSTEAEGIITHSTALTNSYTPGKVSAQVKKAWDDAENQDGKRPEAVKVVLRNTKDGAYELEVTLNADNGWTATVNDLPEYTAGVKNEYYWTEDTDGLPDGYSLTETKVDGILTTLTNSYVPKTVNVAVEKIWDDSNNQDGKRPDEITVVLNKNGEEFKRVVLNEANTWKAGFTDLPQYTAGQLNTYEWVEAAEGLPDGYELRSSDTTAVTENGVITNVTTLTNSYTPQTVDVSVKKVWKDNENQDGKRPEQLEVTLVKNGLATSQTVILNQDNGWTSGIKNLPKYENGSQIRYTWSEEELPDGYTMTENKTEGTITTITNSYTPGEVSVQIIKAWDDNNNQDNIRPSEITVVLKNRINVSYAKEVTLKASENWSATVSGLPEYTQGAKNQYYWTEESLPSGYELAGTSTNGFITTITNRHTPEKVSATVKKIWDDAKNQDGVRPQTITVDLIKKNGTTSTVAGTVTLDQTNDWTATISNLDKFTAGVENEYTWSEHTEGWPEGYRLSSKVTEGSITTLTNSYTPQTVDVSVKKVWKDNENQDGKRPDSIQVVLKKTNESGTEIVRTVILKEDNQWTCEITGLPEYTNQQKNTYTWTEDETGLPEGYTLTNIETVGNLTTITNSYTPGKVSVTIEKKWLDSENQDGIRPEQLEVILLKNGDEYKTVTLTQDNGWRVTVDGLDEFTNKQKNVYTWDEKSVPAGYELTGKVTEGTLTTITNTHTTEKTRVTVHKVWDDEENQDGMRPSQLKVSLLKNGTSYQTVVLTEENNWTYTVTGLDKYSDSGTLVEYRWEENTTEFNGYTLTNTETDDGTATTGRITTLTNTHVPGKIKVSVEKCWDDQDNQDGKRPTELKVDLKKNGTLYTTVTLNAGNGWKATVSDLDEYENGQLLRYTWEEHTGDLPQGYSLVNTTRSEGNAETGVLTTLTNKYEPGKVSVSGEKTWNDADNQDGKRPARITINLLADGVKIDSKTVTAQDGWKWSFTGLDEYKNGKKITYTIEEEPVAEYTSVVDGYNVENTHIPDTINIEGKKTWNDAENKDGIRPESITVTLLADLKPYETRTVTAADNWEWKFTNLPKYKNVDGKVSEIGYTIQETVVVDKNNQTGTYTSTVNGFDIENTHIPETVEVSGTKTWNDNDNVAGNRPETIVIHLWADGKEINKTTVSSADGWKWSFDDLPKYADGKLINYEITEDVIEYYTPKITKTADYTYTVENDYTPEVTTRKVTKIWNDMNNADELRPDSISVQLLANGKAYGDQVTLNSENGWSYEWTDLPVKLGKKTAVYTVEEIGTVTGYTTAYSADTFTITNTHDPKVYVEGKKTWNDNDNQDGLRPTSITINLLADGEQIDSMVVTPAADGTWSWRFDNLPKFKNVNGTVTKIQYSIEEIKVEGYESRKDYTNDRFNLINTHKPETIDLSGTKTWNDSNNQDGKRPSSIRINLLADGVKVAEKTVTASDGWSYKFTGMPKYAKGKEIRYTVTEDIVDGYTTSYSADGLSVINNYTPERTGRSVVKIWNDSNNADQIRPASIQVQLMADGSAYGSAVTLSSSNNWSYTWTELPVKQNGKIIEYTVREITNASGYTTAITLNGTTFTIVNTHTVTTPPPSPSGDPSSSPSSTPSATPSGNPSTTPGITPTPSSATTSTPDPETGEVLGARRGGAVLGARRGLDQAVLGKRRRPSTGDSAAMIIWVITLFGAMGGAAVSIAGLRKKDNKK